MTTPREPATDAEIDAAAGELHEAMKALAEARELASNYRGTEDDYRMLAEAEEAKLPALRLRLRAKLEELRP